ncbi:MAG: hypothetical protein K2Y39_28960 [Candidatus Obscuribacterales bacterium]|nr:hypothetical protein [Candidatus Obscuribacterales bacterium]
MPQPFSGEGINIIDASALAHEAARDMSYLDLAIHATLEPLASKTTESGRFSDELVDYTKGFLKAAPLFMKGRLAAAGLILSYGIDEVRVGDSWQNQLADIGFGSAKGLVLKSTLSGLNSQGLTPGMTGVSIGIVSRISDAALTRKSYFDAEGNFCAGRWVDRVIGLGLNPKAMAVDALTFAASDVLWARTMNHSRGRAWYRPEITHAISGGAMGVSSEFGHELFRQVTLEGELDAPALLRRSALRGAFDAAAGGLGGAQTYRFSRLRPEIKDNDAHKVAARSTPFQRAIIADEAQIALRDGVFVLERKLPALTMQTWIGWVHAPDGRKIRSIFRPDNGSEAFAHRMQSELAAYGLQTLGFKMAVPVTVARKIELSGKVHSGYIQEMEGVSLAAFAANKLGKRPSQRQLAELIHSNEGLKSSYSNAWLHRMIMGEWDNHALNMIVNQKDARAPSVRNIDLGDGLRPAETMRDLIPSPGVRQGYDTINAKLYGELAGQRLDEMTVSYLRGIQRRFSTPLGRSQMLSVGMTPQQSDGVLGRVDWLIQNGRMPQGREPLFYLPLNDVRRAVERFFGKPKAQSPDDQTNFFR